MTEHIGRRETRIGLGALFLVTEVDGAILKESKDLTPTEKANVILYR